MGCHASLAGLGAARDWLVLADGGQWDACWAAAARVLQARISAT
jgi:hypothetical protein